MRRRVLTYRKNGDNIDVVLRRVLFGAAIALAACSALANGSKAKVIVLGRLGETTRAMGIHEWMSSTSHVLWTVDSEQYLVVGGSQDKHWRSVLLQNGQRGYVPTDSVILLPFNVTKSVTAQQQEIPGDRYEAASNALQYLGTKYVWGGNSLTNGIDCSGFVKKLFGQIGIDLPRTAAEQALVGVPVTRYQDLQVGDRLYFWEAKEHKIGHTGLYIGNGKFVHSSVNHHGVAVDYLSASWRKILVAARR